MQIVLFLRKKGTTTTAALSSVPRLLGLNQESTAFASLRWHIDDFFRVELDFAEFENRSLQSQIYTRRNILYLSEFDLNVVCEYADSLEVLGLDLELDYKGVLMSSNLWASV